MPERLDVAVLSDDVNLCALLQHSLALSREPRFRVEIVSPRNCDPELFLGCDLVFIDQVYGAMPYLHTLRDIVPQLPPGNRRAQLVLLVDEGDAGPALEQSAEAIRLGVDAILLRSDLSLPRVRELLAADMHTPQERRPPASALPLDNRPAGAAANHRYQAETQRTPDTAIPQAAIAPRGGNDFEEHLHTLAIDLESQRIHIAAAEDSPLFDEPDTLLSLADWFARMDQKAAQQFETMLQAAAEYRSIPRAIECQVRSDRGQPIQALIDDIQIKNNGQGRVVGASADLRVFAAREYQHALPRAGFDNLTDLAGDSAELLAGQQSWENIARSLPMMCLLVDEKGYITQIINDEQQLHRHYPHVEVGQRLSDVLDIDSLDNLVETIARTLNTGKEHQQTIACSGEQGLRWLDTYISKLKGDAGLSRQVVWTAFDVTSTRHSYQELLKSHDELFHLIDGAPILFFQKDEQGRFLRANKTFCDHFGLRADVISGRHDDEVFRDSEGGFRQLGQHLSQSLMQNAAQQTSYSYTEERGAQRQQFFWNAFPLQRSGGTQADGYAAFGFLADGQALPSVAGDSDDSATGTALQLSGAVGRDFREILGAIVKYTEMAIAQNNQARGQRIADHLEEVLKTAAHAHELVAHKTGALESDDSPKQSGKSGKQATKLQPLIEEIIEMMRPTMPASLSLQTEIDKKAPAAMIAETPFKQIVLQLLVSARNTAIAAQNNRDGSDNSKQEILLTLSQDKLPDAAECSACEDTVSGDYIVLAVHTRTADVSSVDLQKLIVAARTATRKNAPENVVAMAHNNHGHAIIEQQNDSLALQLLFRKA